MKEGITRNPAHDYGEDEELHVMISGDTKEDVSMPRPQPSRRRDLGLILDLVFFCCMRMI